jgi:hypothetical protein
MCLIIYSQLAFALALVLALARGTFEKSNWKFA